VRSLLYAVKRSIDLGRRAPAKFLNLVKPSGWRSFLALMQEGAAARRKAALPKEERQRLRQERRQRGFASDAWQHDQDISVRRYNSYEDYVAHQRSKLANVEHLLVETGEERVAKFRRRFELLTELPPHASVLCLAARLGHEVEAFIALGHFAIGIDLNPGTGNRHVVTGDFHALAFADDSVDCVFTNSLDHVFDLAKITSEISRVLKPGGYFVTELFGGYEEGFVAGDYEATHWRTAQGFGEKLAALGGLELTLTRDLTSYAVPNGLQCIMRKPSR
jgi:SAM-dependent methyltransferase